MKKVLEWYCGFRDRLLAVMGVLANCTVGVLLVMVFTEIVLRTVFKSSNPFLAEHPHYIVAFIPFLYIGVAFQDNKHISVDIVDDFIGDGLLKRILVLIMRICIVYASVLLLKAAIVIVGRDIRSGVFTYTQVQLPQWVYSISFVVGMAVLVMLSIEKLITEIASFPLKNKNT